MNFCSPRSFNRKAQPKPALPHKNRHLSLFQQLDLAYINTREVICNTEFYRTTTRHIKARLYNWFQILDHIIVEQEWKRNRNNYIKLLNLMCQTEVVVAPFYGFPPEGELPCLKTFEINEIIDSVEKVVNRNMQKYGECTECSNRNSLQKQLKEDSEVAEDEWANLGLDDQGTNSKVTNYFSIRESNMASKRRSVNDKQDQKQNQSSRSNSRQGQQIIEDEESPKFHSTNKPENAIDLDHSAIDMVTKAPVGERGVPPKLKKPNDKGRKQFQTYREQINWQKETYSELVGQIRPKTNEYFQCKKEKASTLTFPKDNCNKQTKFQSQQTSRQTCMHQLSARQNFPKKAKQDEAKKSIISTSSIYLLEDRPSISPSEL